MKEVVFRIWRQTEPELFHLLSIPLRSHSTGHRYYWAASVDFNFLQFEKLLSVSCTLLWSCQEHNWSLPKQQTSWNTLSANGKLHQLKTWRKCWKPSVSKYQLVPLRCNDHALPAKQVDNSSSPISFGTFVRWELLSISTFSEKIIRYLKIAQIHVKILCWSALQFYQ